VTTAEKLLILPALFRVAIAKPKDVSQMAL
jgi:hypothetical protein